jgi:hypothetical protein
MRETKLNEDEEELRQREDTGGTIGEAQNEVSRPFIAHTKWFACHIVLSIYIFIYLCF